jgi:hypothetical protein
MQMTFEQFKQPLNHRFDPQSATRLRALCVICGGYEEEHQRDAVSDGQHYTNPVYAIGYLLNGAPFYFAQQRKVVTGSLVYALLYTDSVQATAAMEHIDPSAFSLPIVLFRIDATAVVEQELKKEPC